MTFGCSRPGRYRKLRRLRLWVARLGAAGFAFFLIKGLVWLAITWLIARGTSK
jgi:hypothetical protein